MEHYDYFTINAHETQQSVYINRNFAQHDFNQCPNRFVYVNQSFVNMGHANTVLINPNFKQTVHINPNFKPVKPKIHVNPEILNMKKQSEINKTQTIPTLKHDVRRIDKPIVSTRTKLIRASNNLVKRSQFEPIFSKYKIIRSSETPIVTDVRKDYSRNRYKIDKTPKKIALQKRVVKSKYYLSNKNSPVITKKDVNRSKYISINGTLYKKSPNVLRKADLSKIGSDVKSKRRKILIIAGQIYKLGAGNRALRRIVTKDAVGGKSKTKVNVNRRVSLSKGENKMRKCNVPCPVYRKFGKCRGKERGTCIRVHNPDQVSLCTRFLQGACFDDKCLLSHKVSPEKMPTCKYYLEGLCSREDCQYLHVKISSKADICKDFLQGFCKDAKECMKRHQLLCPDYEKTGTCSKQRCPYPHGVAVRKRTLEHKVAKKIVRKPVSVAKNDEIDKNVRYYVGNFDCVGQNLNEASRGVEIVCDDVNDEEVLNESRVKRPRLGDLPSFIPLGEEM